MDIDRLLDPRFRMLDPTPVPLPEALGQARDHIAATGSRMLGIADAALTAPWDWVGGGQADVRSGLYIAIMGLHEASGVIVRAIELAGFQGGAAAGALTAATGARWDLHGLLGTLDEATVDAAPGDGEWDIRHTLGHIIEAQRLYPWFTAWWLARAGQPGFPAEADEAHGAGLPSEADERSGSLAELRARLDALLDLSTSVWLDADDADLATPARWSGFEVSAGFRLQRWAAHLAEHTVQVDKTLSMLRRPTTEVERLHRMLLRTYGVLEAAVFSRPRHALEAPCGSTDVGETLVAAGVAAAALIDECATAAAA